MGRTSGGRPTICRTSRPQKDPTEQGPKPSFATTSSMSIATKASSTVVECCAEQAGEATIWLEKAMVDGLLQIHLIMTTWATLTFQISFTSGCAAR